MGVGVEEGMGAAEAPQLESRSETGGLSKSAKMNLESKATNSPNRNTAVL